MAKLLTPFIIMMFCLLGFFATAGVGFPVLGSTVVKLFTNLTHAKHKLLQHKQVLYLIQKIDKFHEAQKDMDRRVDALDYLRRSFIYCGHHDCSFGDAYYDADNDHCVCPWTMVSLARHPDLETLLHPDANCSEHVECASPLLPVFNPFTMKCACNFYQYPSANYALDVREPKKVEQGTGSGAFNRSLLNKHADLWVSIAEKFREADLLLKPVKDLHVQRRQASTVSGAVPLPPLPTFVPPPKTDITPALIEQSLAVKPQQNAKIHSVIPRFADGLISFYIQLDGPVPQSLQLNATDSMPCAAVDAQPDANLIVVPHNVYAGVQEVTIPDCLIIAVNKINATWINYWVQKTDGSGSIHSLLGDAQVHDIDRLDTSKPAALSIRVSSTSSYTERALDIDGIATRMRRHQIIAVNCDNPCTVNGSSQVQGANGVCGCFKDEVNQVDLAMRAVNPPDVSNAVMTAKACAAMTCINNGDKPALFNPFSRTCWCAAPTFVEINEAAHGA